MKKLAFLIGLLSSSSLINFVFQPKVNAAIVKIDESAFLADAGLITFSEFARGTNNPTYNPNNYGGNPLTAPTVTFGGYYVGQSIGNAAICPPGAAVSGCVVGTPTGTLTLDSNSPTTFITDDGANPTSPVLSGTPRFNGAISILFDKDLAGVGLDGGFFDAIGGTAITAFARNGSTVGSVQNTQNGIEFLGLVTNNGSEQIAGLQFSLVGSEPAGFAIDNLRFGQAGQVIVPPTEEVPEPLTILGTLTAGAFGTQFMKKRKKMQAAKSEA
jgi:hypothetical protein